MDTATERRPSAAAGFPEDPATLAGMEFDLGQLHGMGHTALSTLAEKYRLRLRPDGTRDRLPDKSSGEHLQAGDRFVLETSGGGGMGDPSERDPALVARDLAEGRITAW